MEFSGGCYCKELRYKASGDPVFKGQCHCRECQYGACGSPNVIIGMPEATFEYTQGAPSAFSREDLDNPVTREFCNKCGTQILTKAPGMPGALIIKVGTMDDPSLYGMPDIAIHTSEKQAYHTIPDGVAAFEKLPG